MAAERKVPVIEDGALVLLPAGPGLEDGDIVALETTEHGLLLIPQDSELNRALDELGEALRAGGFDLETLVEDGRAIRDELLLELYGIDSAQSRGA